MYLDYFRITNKSISSNIKAGLSLLELRKLISYKRNLFLRSFSKITSKAIYIKKVETGKIESFNSITSAVKYFKSKYIKANRNKIAHCLNINQPYLGYTYYLNEKFHLIFD